MTILPLDGVGIGYGMREPDIGCGSGAVTFMATDRVGSNAQVIDFDLDAGALQLARV